MTSSTTTSNSLISSLSRSSPSLVTSAHRVRTNSSSSSSNHRHNHRSRLTGSHIRRTSVPVDLNNNNNNHNNNISSMAIPDSVLRPQNGQQQQQNQQQPPQIVLDRVAILKAFSGKNEDQPELLTSLSTPTTNRRSSRFEKPTTAREARHRRQQRKSGLASSTAGAATTTMDPAVELEFLRLRESVPSIAGANVSDLTIINEAISLICDLESQLIRKLKNQQLQIAAR